MSLRILIAATAITYATGSLALGFAAFFALDKLVDTIKESK